MSDLERAAAACRMTPGGYVAEAGLAAAHADDPEAAVADYRRAVRELMEANRQTAAIGNNLNQLTRHLNATDGPWPEPAAVHSLLTRVQDALDHIDEVVDRLVRR